MMTIAARSSFSSLALALAILCATELRAQQLPPPSPPPPSNDNLVNALEVSGLEFQLEANLKIATREAFEPISAYNYGQTAWWIWTAPEDGIYEWNSTTSSNLVAVSVYLQDAFADLTPIATTYRRPHTTWDGWLLVPDPTDSFQAEQGNRYLKLS
jgi:hypothetical protein